VARRVAINGFGWIGRLAFWTLWMKTSVELEAVAVDDPTGAATEGLLLEYDSNHGRLPGAIRSRDGWIESGAARVRILCERDWSWLDRWRAGQSRARGVEGWQRRLGGGAHASGPRAVRALHTEVVICTGARAATSVTPCGPAPARRRR
jgi:hypothetical protein